VNAVATKIPLLASDYMSLSRVAWPSGLRRWFKAPVSSGAWVRIPPLPCSFWCGQQLFLVVNNYRFSKLLNDLLYVTGVFSIFLPILIAKRDKTVLPLPGIEPGPAG
jgi:hypothetical protein